jgi:hypothetical protein
MKTKTRASSPSRNAFRVLALCFCFATLPTFWTPAAAQYGSGISTYIPPSPATRPKGIPVGPMTAYPSVTLSGEYNDNIFSLPSNEKSSWIWILDPSVALEYARGANAYTLLYRGYKGWYTSSQNDNYWDHQVLGQSALALSTRSDLTLRAEYLDWHDPRGTDYPIGTVRDTVINEVGRPGELLSAHPDLWWSGRVGGLYGYGAQGAQGRIEILAEQLFRRYTNNDQEDRDRNTTNLGATFYYRVMPKTSLLVGYNQSRINYVNQSQAMLADDLSLSSTDHFYNGGVTWEATAKTTGTLRLGYRTKNFDSPLRSDFDGFAWDLDVTWQPKTYSVVDLTSGLVTYEEPTGIDNYVETKYIAAQWKHGWSSRVNSTLGVLLARDDYSPTGREDNRWQVGLSAGYLFRPWLNVGAGFSHNQRSSSEPVNDFDTNVYTLFIEASM